jgi:formate hydrogenlyase transcriptional activator
VKYVGNDSTISQLETRDETLIRVSHAFGVHRDPQQLFDALAEELHRVVPFNYIYVSLRDEKHHTFNERLINMEDRREVSVGEKLPADRKLTSWVFEHQQPLVTSTAEIEADSGCAKEFLQRLGIRSVCVLPLTTVHRKLGAITLGSKKGDAYSLEEAQLLSVVAEQIALAFDDALNFKALASASVELRRKNERLELLLDITNRLVSSLEFRDLLRGISQDIRRVMHCDYAGLSLPENNKKDLRLYAVDFPEGKGLLHEELVYPIEGAPSGTAFRTMKPLTLRSPFTDWLSYPIIQMAIREELKSFAFLPLISKDHPIGVLVLGRLRDDVFGELDINFLSQIANQIALAVENALAFREIRELKDQLSSEKLYLEDEIRSEMNFSEIIGSSPALRKVLKLAQTVAPTDSTVLIYGETGTGKELIARAIHDLSPRRAKPFVKLNCAAIPTGLLESELFGHEKGAFTGAIAQRIGRFEVADSGTIFLDEIGEVPLELQSKLLRVLQEREFERLGSSRTLRADARLIAATNRDLESMVNELKFRSDLFFRLNVFPIQVPPLRERQEDIPLLVRHFTQQFSRRMNRGIDTIPSAAMDALCRYRWPGNIRELQNVIERTVIISPGPAFNLDFADMQFPKATRPEERPATPKSPTDGALHEVLQETERHQILEALKECNWVVAGAHGAAARLGMKRSTLQKRVHKLGIARRSA